jgi:hypothetical protein
MLNSKIKEGKRKNHVSVAAQKEIKKKSHFVSAWDRKNKRIIQNNMAQFENL